MLALIVSVCLRGGELDYTRFWSLPEEVQETLLEHERNLWTGAYGARDDAQAVKAAQKADADAMAALRSRGGR